MNAFLIVGIICILICLLLTLKTEGFEDVNPSLDLGSSFDLDPSFLTKYNKFMKFYNTFMENWTKSIITSMNTDAPVKASSSQNTGTPPQPTIEQMNQYIQSLNKKESKIFPPITESLPEIKTTDDLNKLQLPQKSEPFKIALDWMNTNLSKALESMPTLATIQGFVDIMRGYHVEGFKDAVIEKDVCQQITSCQEAKNKQNIVIQKDMEKVFDEFDKLEPMLQKNQELIAKSKEIQDKAENGSLLPKAPSMPSPYRLPSGSDKLQKMKQDDPDKYKEYEKNYAPFVAMKQSFDGINSVLR